MNRSPIVSPYCREVSFERQSHQARTIFSMSRLARSASATVAIFTTRLVSPVPLSSECLPGICAGVEHQARVLLALRVERRQVAAEIVVMEGDTSKPGPFTLRLRFPDGYTVASHTHPVDEHITVIQGTLLVGMGPTGEKETALEMPTGSFFLMPSMTQHYVWAKGVTIVQAHGVGPTALVYVNPGDDPRKP